jgi:tetratricopeptide (TPR) repeat protein
MKSIDGIVVQFTEAKAIYRKALEGYKTVLGRNHPYMLTGTNNLIQALRSQGKCTEAEAIYREALKLKETVLGRDHPSILNSMNNLALVLDS